jgi:archaemetzincin
LTPAKPQTATKEADAPAHRYRICVAVFLFTILSAFTLAATDKQIVSSWTLRRVIKTLTPLHLKITPPGPSDWLAQHKESGQTFRQYTYSQPSLPEGKRRIIYVQPIGKFTEAEQRIVTLSANYMSLYFNRPVLINKSVPLSVIPDSARRQNPMEGGEQILTSYVLYTVLKPRLPENAAALIAFTASDLWPGEGWNFVFGMASIRERVGVWSISRNGNPEIDDDSFRLCLRRTMKTAVHETGHMFSMRHCTAYECCMCGSNHRGESDRRPVWLCPECVAKVCWATQTDPIKRYSGLVTFCDKNGFPKEAAFFRRSIRALGGTVENRKDPPKATTHTSSKIPSPSP